MNQSFIKYTKYKCIYEVTPKQLRLQQSNKSETSKNINAPLNKHCPVIVKFIDRMGIIRKDLIIPIKYFLIISSFIFGFLFYQIQHCD